MKSNKPFIHIIDMPLGKYIYDVNKNTILKANDKIVDVLIGKEKAEIDYSKEIENICELEKKGFFSHNRPKKMIHPEDKNLEYTLNNRVTSITIQVTQSCNFRCSYCIYGDSGNEQQRKHSSKKMDLPTAKKCIDFLFNHSRDTEVVSIGFYGGEPLLEKKIIKQCVEYAEELFEGKEINYSITVNGSLLNEDAVIFFEKYNFNVLISFDGPKDIQNMQRRLALNGSGTYDLVEENLKNIRINHKEFIKNISINSVIDPINNLDNINGAFEKNKFLKGITVQQTEIDDEFSDEKTIITYDYLSKKNYEIFKGTLAYLNKIDKDKINGFATNHLVELTKIEEIMSNSIPIQDEMSHAGPCIPGAFKLFSNAYGDLYPCERVSELSDVMKIGNINSGFDIFKARKILNIAQITEEKCINCWAISHCSLCAKYADNGGEFSSERIRRRCFSVKGQAENLLKFYIILKEIRENFLV
jgi:uncharacterized protein